MNKPSQTIPEILPAVSPELQAILDAEQARKDNGGEWDNGRSVEAARGALVPVVGMAATILHYTDADAATVVAVSKNGKTVTLREDTATLLNGFNSGEADALTWEAGGFAGHTSGTPRYAYTANPDGATHRYSRRERTYNGRKIVTWIMVGHATKGGPRATIGRRSHNYDFNY